MYKYDIRIRADELGIDLYKKITGFFKLHYGFLDLTTTMRHFGPKNPRICTMRITV
jgi:hypothetical protein